MLHPSGSTINDSDDDDDYELPSLAERVQISLKLDRMRMNPKEIESDSDAEFSNILEGIQKNYMPIARKKRMNPKAIESDSDGEFSNILEGIQKNYTPIARKKEINCKESESDSDESFSKFLENFRTGQTPLARNKGINCNESESDSDGSFSKIIEDIIKDQTPLAKNKGIVCKESESDSDGSFSRIIENIRTGQTPLARNKAIVCEESDSDSDESFSKFLENFRTGQTPLARNKHMIHEKNKLENDTLPNICKELSKIYVSEQENTNDISVPPIVSEKHGSLKKAVASKSNSVKVSNEEEYAILFPIKPDHLSSKDQTKYGQKLYNFFNEKIFNSELPKDMPLIWSGALLRCAGLTHCRRKNEVRSCSIKLSSKLLTSFDRLQDTLLHEMCHTAVWMISKSNEQHGPLWKSWASRCKLILPFVECPERCHSYELPYRVWYHCLNCKWKIGRCKRSAKLERSVCKTCKASVVMTRTE